MSHPSLTPAEAERLEMLAEEAGEVVQAAMKVLRHGYASFNPDDPMGGNNRENLSKEIGNLQCVVSKMVEEADITDSGLERGYEAKEENWGIFTHHQVAADDIMNFDGRPGAL